MNASLRPHAALRVANRSSSSSGSITDGISCDAYRSTSRTTPTSPTGRASSSHLRNALRSPAAAVRGSRLAPFCRALGTPPVTVANPRWTSCAKASRVR
eukprot:3683037-Rhodomonas_salina.2